MEVNIEEGKWMEGNRNEGKLMEDNRDEWSEWKVIEMKELNGR